MKDEMKQNGYINKRINKLKNRKTIEKLTK